MLDGRLFINVYKVAFVGNFYQNMADSVQHYHH
jgi:hypothetical protein